MARYFRVRVRSGALDTDLDARLNGFTQAVNQAAATAAQKATAKTRNSFKARRPQDAPARRGRSPRRMTDGLEWKATGTGVEFDVNRADRYAKYWIIQEIGTGKRATIKRGQPRTSRGGQRNPVGRPKAGATYVRTVRSQRGRLISNALAFGTGPTGAYVPPGSGRGQQLYLKSKLKGVPPSTPRRKGALGNQLVISKEITGQHFVQKGGQEGFREYQTSVLAAARLAFKGRPRRP